MNHRWYKKVAPILLVVFCFNVHICAFPASSVQREQLLHEISSGFSGVAKKSIPAVVYIENHPGVADKKAENHGPASKRKGPYENPFDYFNDEFFNRFFGFQSHPDKPIQRDAVRGTGFIVSNDGYIVTNNHVVDGAGKILVTMNSGKKVTASVIGTDAKTDLAVIKIDEANLPFLLFGDSDTLEIGEWAIAIGNPFGLQATVTVGIISAKGRNQLHIADFEDFIQTDASINPGNSGGPLLNIDGEVIGVNTAIVSNSGGYMGIGFAIPSLMVRRIIDQLIKDGQVTRGFLGVTLQSIDAELAGFYKLTTDKGALVTDVVKDSPADKAGLKQEDVIVSFNGKDLESMGAFRNAISLMQPKSKVVLKIIRETKPMELTVIVDSVPGQDEKSVSNQLGLKLQNITPDMLQQYNLHSNKGVLITAVEPGSSAASVGIKPGNTILAINRKKIASVEEAEKILKDSIKEGKVLFMVSSGDVIRFVAMQLE